MEFGSIKLKITLLVITTDKTKNTSDLSAYKFLLNENNEPISHIAYSLVSTGHDVILKDLFKTYINYEYNYAYKTLISVRSQDDLIEICYMANMPFIKGFNKKGNLLTLEDFNNDTIELEEYYGELFAANGNKSFR